MIPHDVIRFHAHADHRLRGSITIKQHQWDAAWLYLRLCPSPELDTFHAILRHDEAETVTGDTPAPAKNMSLGLSNVLWSLAYDYGIQNGIPEGHPAWLRLCDRLADYLHMLDRAPDLADRDGWPETRAEILALCDAVGIDPPECLAGPRSGAAEGLNQLFGVGLAKNGSGAVARGKRGEAI